MRALLLTPLLVLWGCGDDGTLAGVRAKIEVSPAAGAELSFDEVVLGFTEVPPQIITVSNVGDFNLQLNEVRIEGDGFVVSSAPDTLGPGQSGEVFVRFEPTTPGRFEATLTLESNDIETPEVSFTLTGPAREKCRLEMEAPHSVFAIDDIKDVLVTSASSHECIITRLLLDQDIFQLQDEPELPWTIPPNTTVPLSIKHVAIAIQPGIPTRELRLKESEGTERIVTLEGEPPLANCLSISPDDRLLFPTTPVGQIVSSVVTISNSCNKELFVLSAAIGTGPMFSVDTTTLPATVPANGSVLISVSYDPFSEEGDRGVLNVNTTDAAHTRFSVELFGSASKPRVSVFPEGIDFGGVVLRNPNGMPPRSECGSPNRYAQLYSVGDADVRVSQLALEGGDDLFQIESATVDGAPVDHTQPFVVPANKEGRINLRFSPSHLVPVEHENALLVHHNAEGSPTRVLLQGTARDDTIYTDGFTQLDGPRIDLLFVLQNTFLTEDEHSKLADQVESFVTLAESANADYQIAVTVTDSRSSNAGRFRRCFPHPAIMTPDYADQATRIEALDCMVKPGINGSFLFVDGLGGAKAAIERALDLSDQDPNSNPNAGFIRPDAKLMVVILSTRDDDSVESNALLRDYFLSVKGAHRPDRMVVHAIAGPVLGPCENQRPFFVWPGYRYFWMTNEVNGVFFNVCEEDWTPFFSQIGLDVFSPIDEWDLSGVADLSTMVVTVDSSTISRSPTDGYTYSPVSNSVTFHGSALPQPGANVEISYRGLCRP